MKIAFWQDGTWCCDTQMPEMRDTDYDVLLVAGDATDDDIDSVVRSRILRNRCDTYRPARAATFRNAGSASNS